MPLLLSELIHLLITCLLGVILYRHYRKWIVWPAILLTGFFLDIDHFVDYFLYYGSNLNLPTFFGNSYFVNPGTVHVPFHGWEYLLILFLLGKSYKKVRIYCYCLALGLTGHLFWDQLHNCMPFFGYSIIYRVLNNFSRNLF